MLYTKRVQFVNMIRVCAFSDSASMKTMGDRLKDARCAAGFSSARKAAERHGWKISTYSAHENGQNQYGEGEAKTYSRAFKVNSGWLLTGEGERDRKGVSRVRIAKAVGYIGAGAEVTPFNDHETGDGLEEAEIPAGVPSDAALAIVRGNSMYPRYFDNEYLFYARNGATPEDLINRECVVKLTDGRAFVKILRRGRSKGLFTLESWNDAPIEDKAVEWAAPVLARVNRGGK